jgi:hypothetical protein
MLLKIPTRMVGIPGAWGKCPNCQDAVSSNENDTPKNRCGGKTAQTKFEKSLFPKYQKLETDTFI